MSLDLDSIPTEILAVIIGHFAVLPAALQTLRSPTSTQHSDYGTLLALSRTCQRLASITRGLIYRVVEVYNTQSMVLLVRTLVSNHSLGPLIQHLGFRFDMDPSVQDAGHKLMVACWRENFINSQLKGLDQEDQILLEYIHFPRRDNVSKPMGCPGVASSADSTDEIRNRPGHVMIEGIKYGGFIGGVLGILIQFTPCVETIQVTSKCGTGSLWSSAHQGTFQTFGVLMKHIAGSGRAQRLPPLRKVQLVGWHEAVLTWSHQLAERVSNSWMICSTFARLFPSIHRVDTYMDESKWEMPQSMRRQSVGTNVLEVCALECRRLGVSTDTISTAYPNLQKLYLTTWQARLASGMPDLDPRYVDRSLAKLAPTLEYLHIEFPWQASRRDLGPEARLTKLVMLTRLKHLHIQIGALCNDYLPHQEGPFSEESPLALFPLATHLPDSLESFTLTETLHMVFPTSTNQHETRPWLKGEYPEAFALLVLRFCQREPERQPHLRKFCVVATRGTDALDARLSLSKEACAARGTVFELEIPTRKAHLSSHNLLY